MQAMLARMGQLAEAKTSAPSTPPDQSAENSLPSTSGASSSNNESNGSRVATSSSDVKTEKSSSAATQQNVRPGPATSSHSGSRKSSQDGRTPSPSKLSTRLSQKNKKV